ncbi:Transcription factor [Moelleriella libera RCEF 2490]|uniref:Transcription factor n=1 Tax=Moelleriella libera RCEF 2490 TaxID=1081109 RepID=A0A167ZY75_9HYPO|nr:Transcription factor [Moelleriella libera RCEF 2490]
MDKDQSTAVDEPPQKRRRILACRRCRGRKQKCEDRRPCSNCVRFGHACLPTEPAPRPSLDSQYVKALEERVAELESQDPRQSRDHLSLGAAHVPASATTTSPSRSTRQGERYVVHRRVSSSSSSSSSSWVPHKDVAPGLEGLLEAAELSGPTRTQRSCSQQSPSRPLSFSDDSDSGPDYLIGTLLASPSVAKSGASPGSQIDVCHDGRVLCQRLITSVPPDLEQLLLTTFRARAQAQYPILHWPTFLGWLADWKASAVSDLPSRYWKGFFVHLVYSTAVLQLSVPRVGRADARILYENGIALLPHVFRQTNPIIHVQAYLLLSVNALHRSSTRRLLSLASATIRYCIPLQLHLAETEPCARDATAAARVETQLRRRCFWTAYSIDRLVMSSFELPPSIPDAMISAKLYANIDDEDLGDVAANTPPGADELADSPAYTCVSSALHVLQCRRIQSEIFGYTLRRDYRERFEGALDWRIQILSELESYKSRVRKFSDPLAKGHTSHRWLAMIYHYTLLTLYRPTKESVLGAAGDWSIQASSQACLIFRKSQMDRQIAQNWLGLLVQFQSGVTILYCCWATPPEYRTDSYDSPDVADAVRACSNILALLADRWPRAECLRDVFELLAREIPLVDRPRRPPTRRADAAPLAKRRLAAARARAHHDDDGAGEHGDDTDTTLCDAVCCDAAV